MDFLEASVVWSKVCRAQAFIAVLGLGGIEGSGLRRLGFRGLEWVPVNPQGLG